MVNSNRMSDMNNVIKNVNRNGQNILHVCCEGKQHELLTRICLNSNLNAEMIEEAEWADDWFKSGNDTVYDDR